MKLRRWFRRLCAFYKIKTTQIPKYLYELLPRESHSYNTRNIKNVEIYYCRTDIFKYCFFPYVIVEWNKLDINLSNAKSFLIFRNSLLKIGRPIQNPIYNIHGLMGIKCLIKLRLGLSHFNDHKFRHDFQDCLNPLYPSSLEVESTLHYFLHFHYYNGIRKTPLDIVKKITSIIVSNLSDEYLVKRLMYGNPSHSFQKNKETIEASIKFIRSSERFTGSLM